MKISHVILCFVLIVQINSSAQDFLKYDTHAIQAGYVHVTQKIDTVDEGMSGDNCFWDFSKLICGAVSSTNILEVDESNGFVQIENSNLVLSKANDQFYYNINENQLEYNGYITENAVISFDSPIIRMKYPFNYQDKFDGIFSGTGLHYGSIYTSITGSYLIEADGIGTLILPSGTTINNVLRVKSIEYFNETSCKSTEWTITKYLWYTENYRYPVFGVVQKEINDGENIINTHTGYYNENAVNNETSNVNKVLSEMELIVFPNPVLERININYNIPVKQKVTIELFNSSGFKIEAIVSDKTQQGIYNYEVNINEKNLNPGVYFITFLFGNRAVTKKVIVMTY